MYGITKCSNTFCAKKGRFHTEILIFNSKNTNKYEIRVNEKAAVENSQNACKNYDRTLVFLAGAKKKQCSHVLC